MACKCCGPPEPCCCETPPENYTLEFSTIANGTATGCTGLNGVTCLCRNGCIYRNVVGNELDPGVDFSNFIVRLSFECYEATPVVRLLIYGDGTGFPLLATYEIDRADWTCGAANVMDLISSDGDCTGWPATVTLTPDAGHDVCCQCDDCRCTAWSETDPNDLSKVVQRAWEVTFTGITDAGDCASCVDLNDTFCMTTFSVNEECEWQQGGTGSTVHTIVSGGGTVVSSWPDPYPDRRGPYHVCTGCEWRSCYVVPGLCDWVARNPDTPSATGFVALLKTGCEEVILPPTNQVVYHPCVFRVPACHYYLRFGAHGIVDDPPPDNPNIEAGIVGFPIYTIPVDDFDPSGPNVLAKLDPEPYGLDLEGTDECPAGYMCDGWPATITITPVDECPDCEGVPPPEPDCICLPKTDYSPRAAVTGIAADSCADCVCIPELDLCFDPVGATSACTWRSEIDLSGVAGTSCLTGASYALLSIGVDPDPDDVVIGIYDSGDTLLAEFRGALTGFTCDDTAFALTYTTGSADDCDWTGASITLNMHGDPCTSCVCDGIVWDLSIGYDGDTFTWCLGTCGATSDLSEIFGGGGDGLYVVLEIGEPPASYVRLFVYFLASGGTIGVDGVLIGVYNFLSAMSAFSCGASNTLYLSAGNAGECFSDVDETGYTELLDGTASIAPVTCAGTSTYTTPGTYYLCTEAGVEYTIRGWGAGGSGKGGTAGNRNGGGGGGAFSETVWTSDGSTLVIVVPSGGAASSGNGNNGADATVDAASTLMKAAGGDGDTAGTGGAGGAVADCIGDTKRKGGDGGQGGSDDAGGGGGSSAGTGADGDDGDDYTGPGAAAGGTAPTGGGNGGAGGLGGGGTAGSAPGGGGGGADNDTGGNSGAGADGKVEISC